MSKYDENRRLDDLEEEEQPKKKKKKFNIYDFFYGKKANEEASADKHLPRNFAFFFTLLKRNLTNILYINLLTVLANLPVFFIIFAFSGNLQVDASAPAGPLFAPLYGAFKLGASSPAALTAYGLYGVNSIVALWTPAAYALLIIGILLLLVTFGPSMIGSTYLLRNMVRGEPLFIIQDFKYAAKKNFKQGLILGILDLLFILLLLYDIYFFYLNYATTFGLICFWVSVVILLLYFFMRFYIYLLALTFDLKTSKIYKNALIFTILGFKRNIVAFLGMLLVVFIDYLLLAFLPAVGVILPFVFLITLCAFMATYAAWPVVKKLMIEPYYPNYDNPAAESDEASDETGGQPDANEGENPPEEA